VRRRSGSRLEQYAKLSSHSVSALRPSLPSSLAPCGSARHRQLVLARDAECRPYRIGRRDLRRLDHGPGHLSGAVMSVAHRKGPHCHVRVTKFRLQASGVDRRPLSFYAKVRAHRQETLVTVNLSKVYAEHNLRTFTGPVHREANLSLCRDRRGGGWGGKPRFDPDA